MFPHVHPSSSTRHVASPLSNNDLQSVCATSPRKPNIEMAYSDSSSSVNFLAPGQKNNTSLQSCCDSANHDSFSSLLHPYASQSLILEQQSSDMIDHVSTIPVLSNATGTVIQANTPSMNTYQSFDTRDSVEPSYCDTAHSSTTKQNNNINTLHSPKVRTVSPRYLPEYELQTNKPLSISPHAVVVNTGMVYTPSSFAANATSSMFVPNQSTGSTPTSVYNTPPQVFHYGTSNHATSIVTATPPFSTTTNTGNMVYGRPQHQQQQQFDQYNHHGHVSFDGTRFYAPPTYNPTTTLTANHVTVLPPGPSTSSSAMDASSQKPMSSTRYKKTTSQQRFASPRQAQRRQNIAADCQTQHLQQHSQQSNASSPSTTAATATASSSIADPSLPAIRNYRQSSTLALCIKWFMLALVLVIVSILLVLFLVKRRGSPPPLACTRSTLQHGTVQRPPFVKARTKPTKVSPVDHYAHKNYTCVTTTS